MNMRNGESVLLYFQLPIEDGVIGPLTAVANVTSTSFEVTPTSIFFLLLPALPFLTRMCICAFYWPEVKEPLTLEAAAPDAHRSAILAIAGFSLTIFAGLCVIESQMDQGLRLAIYYAGMSFLAYLGPFAIQGHKFTLLRDQVGDAAMDAGGLGLIAALVSLAGRKITLGLPGYILIGVACFIWLLDHGYRIHLTLHYLSAIANRKAGHHHV